MTLSFSLRGHRSIMLPMAPYGVVDVCSLTDEHLGRLQGKERGFTGSRHALTLKACLPKTLFPPSQDPPPSEAAVTSPNGSTSWCLTVQATHLTHRTVNNGLKILTGSHSSRQGPSDFRALRWSGSHIPDARPGSGFGKLCFK